MDPSQLAQKYPDRTPLIIKYLNPTDARFTHAKTKFLVPNSMTLSEFQFVLRKHIPSLRAEEALFITTTYTNELPRTSSTIGELAHIHKVDSALHLTVSLENTFGRKL